MKNVRVNGAKEKKLKQKRKSGQGSEAFEQKPEGGSLEA